MIYLKRISTRDTKPIYSYLEMKIQQKDTSQFVTKIIEVSAYITFKFFQILA